MIVVADASILVVALGDDSQVGQRARDAGPLLVENPRTFGTQRFSR